jgi:acyl-CoA thioester hydrolase
MAMAQRTMRTPAERGADGAAGSHVMALRVYYEDTDAAGIVYHANYLRFAERARTELLRSMGLTHPQLDREHGIAFVVYGCVINFLAAAKLDDELRVHSRVAAATGASLTLDQEVWRSRELLVRLQVKLACIDADGRAVRLPAAVRAILAPCATVHMAPAT